MTTGTQVEKGTGLGQVKGSAWFLLKQQSRTVCTSEAHVKIQVTYSTVLPSGLGSSHTEGFRTILPQGTRLHCARGLTLDIQVLFSESKLASEMDFVGPMCHPEQRHSLGIIQEQ